MMYNVARTGLMLFLGFLFAIPLPLSAQSDTQSDKADQAKVSSKDKDKDKDKSKNKKKNSDVDNIGTRNINKGSINFFSLEKEIAMGRQLAAEIERQVKLLNDPTINEYVNRVGQNIVRNSDAKVPFTIKVVESDEINAFALPGGFFYVNSGLILAADDESELAAVMAHEIAHVAARHGEDGDSRRGCRSDRDRLRQRARNLDTARRRSRDASAQTRPRRGARTPHADLLDEGRDRPHVRRSGRDRGHLHDPCLARPGRAADDQLRRT